MLTHKYNIHERTTEDLIHHEWLITNGLGGYASGTLSGIITRRYHGLLVAALPSPYGRVMMFNCLHESLVFPEGSIVRLGGEEIAGFAADLHGTKYLVEFSLRLGLPVWRYEINGVTLEKRIVMPYRQNTVVIKYSMTGARQEMFLELRPAFNMRSHDGLTDCERLAFHSMTADGGRYEITAVNGLPNLRMLFFGENKVFMPGEHRMEERVLRIEESRGYPGRGCFWSPGCFRAVITNDSPVSLASSVEEWDVFNRTDPGEAFYADNARKRRLIAMALPAVCESIGPDLVLAADQFIIEPVRERIADKAGERRSVIAGYHWFTDWGRDTMISLEGLALCAGRFEETRNILLTFSQYVKDGLIPNMFPEGEGEGRYNTADATLWYFHAIHRYQEISGDHSLADLLLEKLESIVELHLKGTLFGIQVDPKDGLLTQGAEGYALTWMDAKLNDWVVTPRRGKAVEINALWYNALKLLALWETRKNGAAAAAKYTALAEKQKFSFNERFWHTDGYLLDVVDGPNGDDPAVRPNQLFAISLDNPVLEEGRWPAVVATAQEQLLTPVGLRSLSPRHGDYKPKYFGDLHLRDSAYHQGTVWAWLIGPFIDAWLKVHPGKYSEAQKFLAGFTPALDNFCVGSIGEVFDGEAPFTPRGCIAQAWSVAEVLRSLIKTTGRG